MNYYEQHLGDYARDAGHLSMLEDGAYRRLIDAYYSRERALPVDVRECCKLAKATSKPERDAVAYVLREFFDLQDDGYHQKRCDKEIARFKDKSEKARASINKRWENVRNENERNTDVSANDIRTNNEGNTPRARPQSPVTSKEQDQEKKAKPPAAPAALPEPPDWVPADAWTGFVDMRRKERHPLTARAAKLVLGELTRLKADGHDPGAVLDQSTRNGWRDVFALRKQPQLAVVGGYRPLPGEV